MAPIGFFRITTLSRSHAVRTMKARAGTPAASRAPPAAAPAGQAPEKPLVLLADDDPDMLRLVAGILEGAGCRVRTAGDGVEALLALGSDKFNLIISDLEMPGLSGGTAHALLRTSDKTRGIPIIFITGQPAERQARLVEFRQDTPILRKPLNLRELALAVEDALEAGPEVL